MRYTCVMSMFLTWLNIKIPFTHYTHIYTKQWISILLTLMFVLRFNWNKQFWTTKDNEIKILSFNALSQGRAGSGQTVKVPLLWIWNDEVENEILKSHYARFAFAKPVQRIDRVYTHPWLHSFIITNMHSYVFVLCCILLYL